MAGELGAHNLDSQVNFLSDLIQTGPVYESPAGQRQCAQEISARLEKFGWDDVGIQSYSAREVSNDPRYVPVGSFGGQYAEDIDRPKQNVIAVLEANKPGKTLILNGHYDVEPVLDAEQWGRAWNSGAVGAGKVWGRGAADMLGGLTSQLYIASRFIGDRDSWRGKIIFNAVADEEIGGNGTLASLHELNRRGLLDEDAEVSCLIAEPSSRVIALESLGFLHMLLRARGQARHMAGMALKDNVLYAMLDTIGGFEDILSEAAHEVNPAATDLKHTFGMVNGGIDAATPMPGIEAEATIFYPVDTPVAELKPAIGDRVEALSPAVQATFSDFHFDGQRSPRGNLSSALDSTRPDTSISMGIFPSPCDARLFSQFGIENVITYGPGSLAQAHSPDEHIAINDIALYNEHLEAAIRQYLGG